LKVVEIAKEQKRPYIEMAIHSSELMAGGSPTFATPGSIEKLYEDLEVLFSVACRHFSGCTLREYHARVSEMLG